VKEEGYEVQREDWGGMRACGRESGMERREGRGRGGRMEGDVLKRSWVRE